jgi:uncharacterized protein DUF6930
MRGMTSKKSRAAAVSPTAKPDQEGFLFPIEPGHEELVSDSKPGHEEHPLSASKPEPEELLLPSHDEAKALCNLAAQIKELAPWQWMQETDVFGVEDPDTGEIGFVSVMGNVGEYEAVAVYPAAEGLYAFIDFQSDSSATPDLLMEIPQVQVSFSETKFLEKRDRELLKSSGLKFTGAKPLFRSYRPGFLPWFITLKEARLLIHALSQTLQVTKRFASEPAIFPGNADVGGDVGGAVDFPVDEDGKTATILVRVPRKEDTEPRGPSTAFRPSSPSTEFRPSDPSTAFKPSDPSTAFRPSDPSTASRPSGRPSASSLVWEDQIKRIPRPTLPPIESSIDASLLRDLKGVRQTTMQLEADLFIGPGKIGTPHERPLALYMLMLADRRSGYIFGFEALTAEDSLNTMYASVPERVAWLLWEAKVLPKQIIVRSARLLDLLEPLEKELKIQLRCANELPSIDEATASMAKWLQTNKM